MKKVFLVLVFGFLLILSISVVSSQSNQQASFNLSNATEPYYSSYMSKNVSWLTPQKCLNLENEGFEEGDYVEVNVTSGNDADALSGVWQVNTIPEEIPYKVGCSKSSNLLLIDVRDTNYDGDDWHSASNNFHVNGTVSLECTSDSDCSSGKFCSSSHKCVDSASIKPGSEFYWKDSEGNRISELELIGLGGKKVTMVADYNYSFGTSNQKNSIFETFDVEERSMVSNWGAPLQNPKSESPEANKTITLDLNEISKYKESSQNKYEIKFNVSSNATYFSGIDDIVNIGETLTVYNNSQYFRGTCTTSQECDEDSSCNFDTGGSAGLCVDNSYPGMESGKKPGSGGSSCSKDSDCDSMFRNQKVAQRYNGSLFCNSDGYCEINTSESSDISKFNSKYEGNCTLKGYENISDFHLGFNKTYYSGCSSLGIKQYDHNKLNCKSLANYGKKDAFCDYENRGVVGLGFISLGSSNAQGNSVKIDGNALNDSVNYTDTGLRNVSFYEDGKPLASYKHNFSGSDLFLPTISSSRNSANASRGFTHLDGRNISDKTIFVERINESDTVCIKDSKGINSERDFSPNCSAQDEVLMDCPGSSQGYNCELVDSGNYYAISPLQNSAVMEYIDNEKVCSQSDWNCTPADWGNVSCDNGEKSRTCQKVNECSGGFEPNETQSCSSGNKTNTCTEDDWSCTDWSSCEDGEQTRVCQKTGSCQGGVQKEETKSCESESETTDNFIDSDFPWTLVLIIGGGLIVILVVLFIVWKRMSGNGSGSSQKGSGPGKGGSSEGSQNSSRQQKSRVSRSQPSQNQRSSANPVRGSPTKKTQNAPSRNANPRNSPQQSQRPAQNQRQPRGQPSNNPRGRRRAR